jgi:hypothetical protein
MSIAPAMILASASLNSIREERVSIVSLQNLRHQQCSPHPGALPARRGSFLGGKEPTRRPPNVPDCVFRRLFFRPGFLSHLRSLRRGGSCTIVDRRKPFRLGEVVEGVGVEERIEPGGGPMRRSPRRIAPTTVPPEMLVRLDGRMETASARALYMFGGNTLFRIHGTNEPNMIGPAASPGCIGTLNSDVRAVML